MKTTKKLVAVALAGMLLCTTIVACTKKEAPTFPGTTGKDYTIPELDLSVKPDNLDSKYDYLYDLSTIDDSATYLGHPDSVLLKGGDILTVYPSGHGKGAIANKISTDNGASWKSSIANMPSSWKNSRETPTVYRLQFTDGKTSDKLLLTSGNPDWNDDQGTTGGFNTSISSDEGKTWSEFELFYGNESATPVVPIVAMASLTQLKENGQFVDKWMAFFHDGSFYNYKTILSFDENGKQQWSVPEKYFEAYRTTEQGSAMCEVEVVRSNGGKGDELCLLTRSNTKAINSLISFSNDEGKTWSEPRELPAALSGERLKADYTKDGRLFITFRSIERGPKAQDNPEPGNKKRSWMSEGWIAWVGTYDDLKNGTEGQYRIKIAHSYLKNQKEPGYVASADTGYCGNVVMEDGRIMTSTYGKFDPTRTSKEKMKMKQLKTFVASKVIDLKDTDALVAQMQK